MNEGHVKIIPSISVTKTFLFFLVPILFAIQAFTYKTSVYRDIVLCQLLAVVGYITLASSIPAVGIVLRNKGISGKDMNKSSLRILPESMGLLNSTVFIVLSTLSQAICYQNKEKHLEFSAALLAMCSMAYLGFVDDVLDLRWRYKIWLPIAAAIPFTVMYQGSTSIVIPKFLHGIIPNDNGLFDIGSKFYGFYMVLFALFCANSINIYAGINGLETGQTIVICIAIIIHNVLGIINYKNVVTIYPQRFENEIFSLILSIIFLACSLPIFCYNYMPATIFIGNVATYFWGMYFAAIGILGHFSKTLIIFFLPQLFNFILSIPQLLKIIPCPRHRIPIFDKETKLLKFSNNLTAINCFLYFFGPMSEEKVTQWLLFFQIMSAILGLITKYGL